MITKENNVQVTAGDLAEKLTVLAKENIVGIANKEKENEFSFVLPGGKSFRVLVEEA